MEKFTMHQEIKLKSAEMKSAKIALIDLLSF